MKARKESEVKTTPYVVCNCLVSTLEAFEGYDADGVMCGIRDFVVSALLSEGISVTVFADELRRRQAEVLSIITDEDLPL